MPIQVWAIGEGMGGETSLRSVESSEHWRRSPWKLLSATWTRESSGGSSSPGEDPGTAALGAFPTPTAALCNPQEIVRVPYRRCRRDTVHRDSRSGPTALGAISALSTVLCNPEEEEHVRQAAAESLKRIRCD